MREIFAGFYAPSEQDYEKLIKEGLIVLDANVLLRLYQFPEDSRKQAIDVLEKVKDRLWIANYAALEYQVNRVGVIAAGAKFFTSTDEKVKDAIQSIRLLVKEMELDKRGVNVDVQGIEREVEAVGQKLAKVIAEAAAKQLAVETKDPIRDQLDEILKGRVGAAPADQAALNALLSDAQSRYDERQPPGYKDTDKEKNPSRATFVFDGIKYERKFGDLIIWKQLIEHAKAESKKRILLVTSDAKEDWWWIEQGKTLGPRPELITEIRKEAAVEFFWAYSFLQFVENARKYLAVDVSQKSIDEIKRATELSLFDSVENLNLSRVIFRYAMPPSLRRSFAAKMKSRGRPVTYTAGDFPSFVESASDGAPHGYEVKTFKDVSISFVDQYQDYFAVAEKNIALGRIQSFTLIAVVLDHQQFDRPDWPEVIAFIERQMSDFENCSIVFCKSVGGVLVDMVRVPGRDDVPDTP